MLSGLFGSALGAVGSIGGMLYNNHHSAREARDADKRAFQTWLYQTEYGPSLQRKGLERAGYNPMLALSQSTPSMPSTHQGTTSTPDIAGSAASMGRFMRDAVKDKVGAEIENVEADTALKLEQAKQAKQNTDLLGSQAERTDLAFSRDIVSTLFELANVGLAAHNAKSLGDLRKAKVRGSKPSSPTPMPRPVVDPKKVAPNASNSAKSVFRYLGELGVLGGKYGIPLLLGTGLGYLEGKNIERDMKRGTHWDPKDRNNPKEKARKKYYLYHDIGF